MDNGLHQLILALQGFFLEEISHPTELHPALKRVQEIYPQLDKSQQNAFADYYETAIPTYDFSTLFYSFLYALTQRASFLIQLVKTVTQHKRSLADFHNFMWQINSLLFTAPNIPEDTMLYLINDVLRPHYLDFMEKLRPVVNHHVHLECRPTPGKRKIAILTPQFLNLRHSPSRECFNVACHLQKYHGAEVHIINTNSMVYQPQGHFFEERLFSSSPLSGIQNLTLDYLEFHQATVPIFTSPAGTFTLKKIVEILKYIATEKFDAVITSGDNLFIQDFIYQKLPSVFIFTGAVIPFSLTDCIWTQECLMTPYYEALAERLGIRHIQKDTIIVSVAEEGGATSRAMFDLPEEAFVFAIVGNRFPEEFNETFLEICDDLLTRHPHVHVAFAGKPFDLSGFFREDLIQSHRVHHVGNLTDLRGFLKLCDAFLNPFRQGGGTSAQSAMIENLPIVTMGGNHIAGVVGPGIPCEDVAAYRQLAEDLIVSEETRLRLRQQVQHRLETDLNPARQVAGIYEKINLLIETDYATPAKPTSTRVTTAC